LHAAAFRDQSTLSGFGNHLVVQHASGMGEVNDEQHSITAVFTVDQQRYREALLPASQIDAALDWLAGLPPLQIIHIALARHRACMSSSFCIVRKKL
jgi:hypothetical protein